MFYFADAYCMFIVIRVFVHINYDNTIQKEKRNI